MQRRRARCSSEELKRWTDDDLETSLEKIQKVKDKLKKYRGCGLEKEGEYSYENLVFKYLIRMA